MNRTLNIGCVSLKTLLTVLALFVFVAPSISQKELPPIVFIYDSSGSMWGQIDGRIKHEIASEVLMNSVSNFIEHQPIGLVVYGHRKKDDCGDVEEILSLNNTSKDALFKALTNIQPLGKTPLELSAKKVIQQLKAENAKATIVLITDGIESCDGSLCEFITQAKANGIDFKFHIVGFGVNDNENEELKCAAEAGGGIYFSASNATLLRDALKGSYDFSIDVPTGSLNVLVTRHGLPIDANVQLFISDSDHQVDFKRTYGDTILLNLPNGEYDLRIWPHGFDSTSPKIINGLQIEENSKYQRTIDLDGAKVEVSVYNNENLWDSQVSILSQNGERVVGGRTYSKLKVFNLDAGQYDIEIEARNIHGISKKVNIENVIVKDGFTKQVAHEFESGRAELGATYRGQPFDANITIIDISNDEKVYAFRTRKRNLELNLNPGEYKVIFSEAGVYDQSAKRGEATIHIIQGKNLKKIVEVR